MSSQTRLFVGNLPHNVDENDLRTEFSFYGNVINLDLKSKSATENGAKKFAFITLSALNREIEACLKRFTSEDFKSSRLYVTRARESFLERLQREREQVHKKDVDKNLCSENLPKVNPIIKLGDKLNPRKRKIDNEPHVNGTANSKNNKVKEMVKNQYTDLQPGDGMNQKKNVNTTEVDKKRCDSDMKRLESIKKKRQEFKEKQKIIQTALFGIDTLHKKIIFSDNEEETPPQEKPKVKNKLSMKITNQDKKQSLFDDDESDDEVNFKIKEQFEGKKGQKVLDLQSRYKSDKRFVLDERFIEDESEGENDKKSKHNTEEFDVGQNNEKEKQLNILQEVLGVAIKPHASEPAKDIAKSKHKMGMVRFDPTNPEHVKFLAPVAEINPESKKAKKNKQKEVKEEETNFDQYLKSEQEKPKLEVSKEQFYKVTETLKESIAQPTTFSLRSLFAKDENEPDAESQEQNPDFISLQTIRNPKVKNPLDPGERNPFVYDSSDSETEEKDDEIKKNPSTEINENRAVWKERLFFSEHDNRLKEGLAFFTKPSESETQKERRELKSLMKKRIYNTTRKNQMFQKKIGGRKKTMKTSFRRKNQDVFRKS